MCCPTAPMSRVKTALRKTGRCGTRFAQTVLAEVLPVFLQCPRSKSPFGLTYIIQELITD